MPRGLHWSKTAYERSAHEQGVLADTSVFSMYKERGSSSALAKRKEKRAIKLFLSINSAPEVWEYGHICKILYLSCNEATENPDVLTTSSVVDNDGSGNLDGVATSGLVEATRWIGTRCA